VQGRNDLFETNTPKSLLFQAALAKLIAITGPSAKMEQLLEGNTIILLEETKTAIRAITNARFKQMINDAPNDPYITAFFLHPEYLTAQICKNINPLDLPPI